MKSVTITGNDYEKIIKTCGPAVDHRKTSDLLNHIELQVKNGRCVATALNGFIITQCVVNCLGSEGTYIIPAIRFSKYGDVVITQGKDRVSLSQNEITYTKEVSQKGYVNWRNVVFNSVKPEKQYTIFVSPKLLMQIGKAFQGESCIRLDFRGKTEPIVINGRETRGLLLPVRVAADEEPKFLAFDEDTARLTAGQQQAV